MDTQSDGGEPLTIPNLQDLYNALEADSDSQKLLDVFKDAAAHIPTNLTAITDSWLKETDEEEDAA